MSTPTLPPVPTDPALVPAWWQQCDILLRQAALGSADAMLAAPPSNAAMVAAMYAEVAALNAIATSLGQLAALPVMMMVAGPGFVAQTPPPAAPTAPVPVPPVAPEPAPPAPVATPVPVVDPLPEPVPLPVLPPVTKPKPAGP